MAEADDLSAIFEKSCNVGVSEKQGKKKTMTTANLTKWFKSAKIYDPKGITTTDTDITFSKVKAKGAKEITYKEFEDLLTQVAPKYQKQHKLGSPDDAKEAIKKKLMVGTDVKAGTTKTSKTGGVDKMTDHTQYTGSHKERFDESGKGKGIEGREYGKNTTGYVGAYKGEGTYEDKVGSKK